MAKKKVTSKSIRQGQTIYQVVVNPCALNSPSYHVIPIRIASQKTNYPELGEVWLRDNQEANIDFIRGRLSWYEGYDNFCPEFYYSRRKAESKAKLRNSIERGMWP